VKTVWWRNRGDFGADWSKDVTGGGTYEYIDLGGSGIDRNDGPLRGPLKGDFSPNAIHVFAVNLTWKF
jgi:hypothetical protein